MARPQKENVDYWPFDVGLFQDRKFRLIRSEFGIKGAYIALELINMAYSENGYYAKFGEEDCLLMSEGVGGGCEASFIMEVVRGCCRRSLFDEGIYNAFGVLTSHGIQQRYLRIIGKNRADVRFIKEYFLLDISDERDVPANIRNKVTLLSSFPTENPSKPTENPSKPTENPQSKVKESKVKESKVKEYAQSADESASAPAYRLILHDGSYYPISKEDISKWAALYPAVDIEQEIRKMIGWSEANPQNRKTKRGALAFINRWLAREQDKGGARRGELPRNDTGVNPYEKYGGTLV